MIFTLRTRPPCTKTAALFAGTEGLLVLIYAKMFNYWIIISRFWRLSTGKLGVFRLFGDGGRHPRPLVKGQKRASPLPGAGPLSSLIAVLHPRILVHAA